MQRLLSLLLLIATYTPQTVLSESFANALYKNTRYTFESYTTHFPRKYSETILRYEKMDNWQEWIKFTGESSAEITPEIICNVEYYAALSSAKHELHGMFNNFGKKTDRARYVDITKLNIVFEKSNYDIMIGKDIIECKIATLYSPMNRYNVLNFANPLHPIELGSWQARYSYYHNNDVISFHIMPLNKKMMFPPSFSRWFGQFAIDYFIRDIASIVFNDHYYSRAPKNWNYLATYNGIRSEYDFQLAIHHGPSPYPVLQINTSTLKIIKVNPLALSISGGIITTKGPWEAYGEAILQMTKHHMDEDFLKFVVGANYTDSNIAQKIGLEELSARVEIARDITTKKMGELYKTSWVTRLFRNGTLFLLTAKQSHQWSYSFAGSFENNKQQKSHAYFARIEHIANDSLSLHLDYKGFAGKITGLFGCWENNDNVEFAIIKSF